MALTLKLTRQLPTAKRLTAWMGCMAGLFSVASMFQPTIVSGNSMEPTLRNGKLVWVDRYHYRKHKPQRGEVVVFKHLGDVYVKRVYRTEGETIHTLETTSRSFSPIREGRHQEIANRFAHPGSTLHVRTVEVPEDHVFVLGDNYFESLDSRELGPIPLESIIGRAYVPVDPTLALEHEVVPPPMDRAKAMRPTVHVASSVE